MQILLLPGNNKAAGKTCLTHRHVLVLGVLFVLVLPVTFGVLAYRLSAALDRMHQPRLEPGYLAQLEATLAQQKAEIAAAKQAADDHLNALATRLGKLQAHMMRLNALGQQLTSMAGLDRGEFDFSEDPGVGGPEPAAPTELQLPSLAESLDALSDKVDQRLQELTLLESLIMDSQLREALRPRGWPVVGGYISSGYGYRRDPFSGRRAFHEGLDIANRFGAPVKAAAAGVVTYAGERPGYGLMVEINHGNGYTTRYAHTSGTLVQVGDKVEKGQKIALVGTSGRSTGPHLHFEILRNGRAINPRRYLRASR